VTVYIANHNYGRFIRQAIESVLRQTMQDFELIIIDDGSTDNSRDVIDGYTGNEKVAAIFQHHQGLNVTNNIALRAARGQYIIRLDADDYLDEHALQILSQVLDRNPHVGLVFPDYYLADEDGNVIDTVRRHNFDEVSLMDQPAHGAGTMLRTECLYEIGGYDEEFNRQDGYELWIRFIQHYGVQNVNLPLFYYRQHGNSLTRDEERLLETRAHILAKRARRKAENMQGIALIPVRGQLTEPGSRALDNLGGKPLIDWTLDAALGAERIDRVIVSSPDKHILSHVSSSYGDNVIVLERDPKLAMLNSYLEDTVLHALDAVGEKSALVPDVLAVLFVESPFRLPRHIDSAIDVLQLFETDSVIAVRPETDIFYQHNGKGLQPLRSGKHLRLEGEEIFREAGDLHVVRVSFLRENGVTVGGKIGHIMMDERSALSVLSDWDWAIAELRAVELAKNRGSKNRVLRK